MFFRGMGNIEIWCPNIGLKLLSGCKKMLVPLKIVYGYLDWPSKSFEVSMRTVTQSGAPVLSLYLDA